nr:MAG TPA: hypothetical protein [Caudoviricetes sp.]
MNRGNKTRCRCLGTWRNRYTFGSGVQNLRCAWLHS